jgi:putative restriction endonuclease
MKTFVANTDFDWYTFLLNQQDVDEVNFWKPLGGTGFSYLREGELFFFKLKKAHKGKIVGFGQFLMFQQMRVQDAWETFGTKNGVPNRAAMMERIGLYTRRNSGTSPTWNHEIGCIIITNPVFFPPEYWVDAPEDWRDQIVSGKGYSMLEGVGNRIYKDAIRTAEMLRMPLIEDLFGTDVVVDEGSRYGEPVLTRPRLGQGGFRLKVTSVYGKCAVSGEHSIPVLEAAHIRPYAEAGSHEIKNGILLRSDIHKLYDRGYVTVDPDYTFRVSDRLKDEFNNGKTYYELENRKIWLPGDPENWPSRENLEYHQQVLFRG